MTKDVNFSGLAKEFPILDESAHGNKLIYLDNAATTQKPKAVLEALKKYYEHENSNVHRGVHLLAERADKAYDAARKTVRQFINAKETQEIIFVRGTTEAINLVAESYGNKFLHNGDKILLTAMEHHSNIVPWQLLRDKKSISLHHVPVLDSGDLDLKAYKALLSERPKLVAITHVSNVLGTVNPVKEMIELAHKAGSLVLVDGAQAVAHMKVDVQDLDADFYVFSGHKMYAPTGIGVLYAKSELLSKMPPYQGGGGMIDQVTFDETTYAEPPTRFEAGTPNISGAVGLAAAINYLHKIGMDTIFQHEKKLLDDFLPNLKEVPNLHVIGNAKNRLGVISFVMDHVHPHDIATILDRDGIATRAGHHCAMPLMERFKVPATARISFALYNNEKEIPKVIKSLNKIGELFKNG